MNILSLTKGLFALILVGKPRLVYRAGFGPDLSPVKDTFDLKKLKTFWSAALGATEPPGIIVRQFSDATFPDGAITITNVRPPGVGGGTVVTGVGVFPVPASLKHFRIYAGFAAAHGPHLPADTWAIAVVARRDTTPDYTDRDSRIAVTAQATWETGSPVTAVDDHPVAKMNAAGGAPVGTPYPYPDGAGNIALLPQSVYDAIYSAGTPSDFTAASRFTITETVDRYAQVGRGRLVARDAKGDELGYYVAERAFINPFIPETNAQTGDRNELGTIGVAIGIAAGNGPVFVTIHAFAIYDLLEYGIVGWFARTNWPLQGLFQGARARMANWAFDAFA